jgi:hypothetical protein
VDLAAGGEMRALVALDSRGRVCGLLIWSRGDAKTIAFRGPWVFSAEPFGQGEAAARALLEELIREVGRSGASGIVTCQAAAHVHAGTGGFERLGSLAYDLPVGRRLARDTFFRLLAEDLGEVVWGHPSIEPFLRSEYERLDLARDIRSAISLGEAEPERSVFSARIEARLAEAELRPLLPGRDAHDNIAGHVRALRADGLVNILFVLDLAHAWQAALAGPLTDNGFKPRMIVPLAGRSDLVVFQHDHAVDR